MVFDWMFTPSDFHASVTCGVFTIDRHAVHISVGAIVEDDNWHAVRLGLAADIPVVDKLRLNVEGAYLPFVWLTGTDGTGCAPELALQILR